MARWQRDPKVRRRIAILLALIEGLMVQVNFWVIFSAYFNRLCVAISPSWCQMGVPGIVTLVAVVLFLPVVIFEGVMFVKARPWARLVFIGENGVLIVLGLLWFFVSAAGEGRLRTEAVIGGLIVPVLTLFPLLWPLLAFRPAPSDVGSPGR